jgi:hypothetical protein
LQGLDKKQVRARYLQRVFHVGPPEFRWQTVEKHGADMVQIWRRSYDTPPPALDQTNPYWPGHDRRCASSVAPHYGQAVSF